MSSLRDLAITTIAVDDFSFLQHCKELRTLSLYNTNFTDCRLLLALPKLKKVDLGLCRLTHTEGLDSMHLSFNMTTAAIFNKTAAVLLYLTYFSDYPAYFCSRKGLATCGNIT